MKARDYFAKRLPREKLLQMFVDKDGWACLWKRAAKKSRAEVESEAKWADEYFRNWQNANKTATRLRGLLSGIEWVREYKSTVGYVLKCPSCRKLKQKGHAADCDLDKELRDSRLADEVGE